jgi:hypothetical protein
VSLTQTHAVASPSGHFELSVRSASRPVVTPLDGIDQVTVPMNTAIAAECFVYHDDMDAAATLDQLIGELVSGMPRYEIQQVDAGNFGAHPYLYQEAHYLTQANAVGVLKGYAVPLESAMLACVHDEPGYGAAFRSVVESMAQSARIAGAGEESWDHSEILVLKVKDMNIGYTLNRYVKDADGDIKAVAETAFIIPRSNTETFANDEYNVTFEHADGRLINGRYAESEDGDLKQVLDLLPADDGGYQVTGTFQGKQVNERVTTQLAVTGPYYQHRAVIDAAFPAQGAPRALIMSAYAPSADPLRMIPLDMRPTGRQVDGLPEYEISGAGLQGKALVDRFGLKTMTIQLGPMEMLATRVYSSAQ